MSPDTSLLVKTLVVLAVLTVGSAFIALYLFLFMVGVTAVFLLVYLSYRWDDIIVWWHTRKAKK